MLLTTVDLYSFREHVKKENDLKQQKPDLCLTFVWTRLLQRGHQVNQSVTAKAEDLCLSQEEVFWTAS